ncbi:MAG TPA: M50 family metallopeptidase [Candidatus Baltobacteraceae bacterium]|nr:M50 family metallopeptidase [Candidatus Baltobacteraceae bacterium]
MTVLLAAATFVNIEKIALFVVMLSVLIVLHEYGHFIIARLNKVRVLEFAVGMGPLIARWTSKRSGTQYSLRALPIGGYCAMHGEDNRTSEADQQREFRQTVTVNGREYDHDNFQAKNAWQRLAIVLAGPVANFILAFVILVVSAVAFGVSSDQPRPVIQVVTQSSPAQRAGLRVNDEILAINGRAVKGGQDLVNLIHHSLNKRLDIIYSRGGVRSHVAIVAGHCPAPEPQSWGCIGFIPVDTLEHVPFTEAVVDAGYAFVNIGRQTFGSLALLVSHPVKYGGQVSGVVGMAQAATAIQDWGWGYYLSFAALISFALGVFNLLPLPALDGGRAAFIVGELVRGKPVDPEKEAWVHITGLAVLIALMIVINFNNVVQIVQGKGPF